MESTELEFDFAGATRFARVAERLQSRIPPRVARRVANLAFALIYQDVGRRLCAEPRTGSVTKLQQSRGFSPIVLVKSLRATERRVF